MLQFLEQARQRHQVQPGQLVEAERIIQQGGGVGEQPGQRQHVHGIVVKHARQRARIPALEVIHVHLRHQVTGHLLLRPEGAQDLALDLAQRPAGQPVAPQAARQRQQVEMGRLRQREASCG